MSIGKVIRYYRKEKKMTQKKLGGIYHSDSHVSDIERGIVFPSHKTLIDFSNILGVNLMNYLEYIDAEDPIKVEEVVEKAVSLTKSYQYKEANDLIKSFKDKDPYFNTYGGKLIVAKYESIYYSREKKQFEQAINTLKYALLDKPIETYGYLEIDIVNNIGIMHTMNSNFNAALKYFEEAYSALKALTVVEEKRLKSSVLYNLARINMDLESYHQVYRYSQELIDYCIENEYTYMLAKAYYNRGIAEFQLENTSEAMTSFKLAYYMFIGLNQSQNAQMLLEYVEEHCQIELIK